MQKRAGGLRAAILCCMIAAGCAGPPALERAIRPVDERAYADALAKHSADPRQAYFSWKSQESGKPVDDIAAADAALGRTRNPFDANRDRVAVSRGAVIFKSHCISCHGEKADGRGPDTRPEHPCKDFHAFGKRFAATLHRGAPKAWYRKITEGHGPKVRYPTGTSRAMPAFGDKLSKEQVWLVITYLQSLDMYVPEALPN